MHMRLELPKQNLVGVDAYSQTSLADFVITVAANLSPGFTMQDLMKQVIHS